MDRDSQLRLASLPSMFLEYLTGSNTPDSPEGMTAHADEEQTPQPTSSTPANIRKRISFNYTPQSTAPSSPTKSFRSGLFPRISETENSMSPYASEDISRENSFRSNDERSKRRMSKPKTSYNICHPPPKTSTRSKIHVRAKPLLQLHRHTASSRPMPAFELLPSAIFSPSLSRAIGKVFRPKHGLCPADLAIVKADKYHQHEESATEEDESRDVLALICKGRKGDGSSPGKAKIFLNDTSEWEAYVLPNGGYEFTSTDEHGLTSTVRWVLKRPRGRRSQSASELDSPRTDPKKFNFSTISPNSRRHPVIANLTSTTLDVQDLYNIPQPAPSSLSPSTDVLTQPEESSTSDPVETTAILHNLITASAIWVALREGWSPGYRYDDNLTRSSSSKLPASPLRASADLAEGGKDGHPRRSGSLARMLGSTGPSKRRSTASVAPTDGSFDDVNISRNSSVRSNLGARRRPRAESTSTVVIHRTAWSRPDLRALRKNTAPAATSYGYSIENNDDMTEEEGNDIEDEAESPVATPSKRMSTSPPTQSAMTTPETKCGSRSPTPVDSGRGTPTLQKREDRATDGQHGPKEPIAGPEVVKKRRRVLRALLCGMA